MSCIFIILRGCSLFFRCFFKELDFKELEIHRYSSMDTINEHQWISINEFIDGPSMIIIDGPSMNMVPFLCVPSLGRLWTSQVQPSICRESSHHTSQGPREPGQRKGNQRKGTIFVDRPSMNSLMEIH